ncbi:hypothetical protein SAY86_017218 [Trapa natans]|uniref:Uncharacterized protein n=1 Tax=Trapa natans TaxID=22666 RepID=A0AAN7LRN9_TRANT|nr:hypothetical protein SAY86_017218 [Trapa natans]
MTSSGSPNGSILREGLYIGHGAPLDLGFDEPIMLHIAAVLSQNRGVLPRGGTPDLSVQSSDSRGEEVLLSSIHFEFTGRYERIDS